MGLFFGSTGTLPPIVNPKPIGRVFIYVLLIGRVDIDHNIIDRPSISFDVGRNFWAEFKLPTTKTNSPAEAAVKS